IQHALRLDSAVVQYTVLESEIMAVVVTSREVLGVRISVTQPALVDQVTAFTTAIMGGDDVATTRRGEALYTCLVRSLPLRGLSQLFIEADDVLASLPF